MIEDTVEKLTEELQKSEEKLKHLRNLRKEIGSKCIAEDAWRRYLRGRLEQLQTDKHRIK